MTNKPNGTLYIGITNDLPRRVWEHKNNITKSFTSKYNLHMLVWHQLYDNIEEAIAQEKRMKEWHRDWKTKVIEEMNPEWNDLYNTLNN